MALVAARVGVSTLLALAVLMFASSGSAGAAVATPLVSTATSDAGGATVGVGTVLTVTFNETPVLASSYSLTLADGSTADTLSSAAGTLSASVIGTRIAFTVYGATSLSLSLLEILASTGVSDASGHPWDLYRQRPGRQVRRARGAHVRKRRGLHAGVRRIQLRDRVRAARTDRPRRPRRHPPADPGFAGTAGRQCAGGDHELPGRLE